MSHVIGVVLLVAITVLLAVTVAAYSFGLGDDVGPPDAPDVEFRLATDTVSGGDDLVEITHTEGDTLDPSRVGVVVADATCSGGGTDPNGRYEFESDFGLTGPVTAGTTVRVDGSSPVACPAAGSTLQLDDASVTVVWQSGQSTSTTITEWAA